MDDPVVDAHSSPAAPSIASGSESKTVYRVRNDMSDELERDRQEIDDEKEKADQMAEELDSLGEEIKQEREDLDRTNQFDVDEFNRKVDEYNDLREEVRAQKRLVNDLVETYNEKLRTNGR